MDFKELAARRYSCKAYDEGKKLTPDELHAILEAGRLAPTAKNLQEQHVYVIQSDEGLSRIDSLTPCRYGAPTVLAVAYNRENVFVYPGGKRDSVRPSPSLPLWNSFPIVSFLLSSSFA